MLFTILSVASKNSYGKRNKARNWDSERSSTNDIITSKSDFIDRNITIHEPIMNEYKTNEL